MFHDIVCHLSIVNELFGPLLASLDGTQSPSSPSLAEQYNDLIECDIIDPSQGGDTTWQHWKNA